LKKIPVLVAIVLLVLSACKDASQGTITIVGKPEITEVILYEHDSTFDGSLGGRPGVNALCQSSGNKPNDRNNFIGFISIDSTDTIGNLPMKNDFPGTVTIKSKTGKIVANSWSELMGPPISFSLVDQDVIAVSAVEWWSGGKNGTSPTNTCNGFTGTASTGTAGFSHMTDNTWVEIVTTYPCTNFLRILCLAY